MKQTKELLDLARHSLEYAAYIYIGSRMFENKNIEKTLAELEQAAIDFSYAKFKWDKLVDDKKNEN